MRFKRRVKLDAGLRQIDIAPLIDCIFILMIFFMLTSSFMVMPAIKVNLPSAKSSHAVSSKKILLIYVTSEDMIYINKKPYSLTGVEKIISTSKGKTVVIKADKDASLGVIVKLWDICQKYKIQDIDIATTYQD